MDDDPIMQMYEAQATVIEQKTVIKELQQRNEELELQLRGEVNVIQRPENEAVGLVGNGENVQNVNPSRLQRAGRLPGCILRKYLIKPALLGLAAISLLAWVILIIRALFYTKAISEVRELLLQQANENLNETILIMGDWKNTPNLNEMLVLDRKTSQWKMLDLKLPVMRSVAVAAYLNGEIFRIGFSHLKTDVYKFDKDHLKWIEMEPMKEGRIYSSVLVFQDRIWVIGGAIGENSSNSVESYDPRLDKWISMPEMKEERMSSAATVCNGQIVVSGGGDNKKGYWTMHTSIESFDAESASWSPLLDMPSARWRHSMVCIGSSLIMWGGFEQSLYYTAWRGVAVWKLNLQEKDAAWRELPALNEHYPRFSAVVLSPYLFAIGQWPLQCDLNNVSVFDGLNWREGPKLPTEGYHLSSIVIPATLADVLQLSSFENNCFDISPEFSTISFSFIVFLYVANFL